MDRIEEKLRLLEPLLSPKQLEGLRYAYLLEKDLRKKAGLEAMMDVLLQRSLPGPLMDQILLPPPQAAQLAGDIPVGQARYAGQDRGVFGLGRGDLIKHTGLFAKTGGGKTTLMVSLLKQICARDIPFLIFDQKRNYRDLLKHPDFMGQDILIFTVGRNDVAPFFFNPKNGPPGVEEHIWRKHLAEIINKVYLLGPGANDVFMEASEEKTFREMQEKVLSQNKKARELLWWASVKRTLNAINYPGLGEMVNRVNGHSIPDLLNKKVILELDGLSASDQAFVIGSLILWIYHYRMRQPEREVLKHLLIVEEAHHLFSKTNVANDITDVLMREIRELGEGVILIDQHPSKMSPSALGNLGTKFCMAMSLNQDVKAVADSMLLDREQQRYLAMLQVGQAICRSDRLDRPMLLNIPYLGLNKGEVTDAEIQSRMRIYLPEPEPEIPGKPSSKGIPGIPGRETLSPLGRILLQSIAENPLLGVVKRFRNLGLKTAQGYRLLSELETHGMITSQLVDGKRLHDLTHQGRRQLGLKLARPGRGGLEHRYWVEQVKRHYTKNEGLTYLEKDDIDLVVDSHGKRLAIQMETGKSDLMGNLMKLGRYQCDLRFMLATNKETELRLKQMLAETLAPNREQIKVLFVKDFMKSLPTI
jgi:DNA-binding PadR family transcriptional regulator